MEGKDVKYRSEYRQMRKKPRSVFETSSRNKMNVVDHKTIDLNYKIILLKIYIIWPVLFYCVVISNAAKYKSGFISSNKSFLY